jgi:hypothetical protein
MKMDEYYKDLEMQVGNFEEPIQLTRIVRLWCESTEVPKWLGGEGTSAAHGMCGKEIYWLALG